MKFVLKQAYDSFDGWSNLSGLCCEDESLALQAPKEECDINTIVKRFGLTGELPSDISMPQSGDFTGVKDFQSAMNIVRAAEEEFMRIPAELRARFSDDPGRLMAFLDDDGNRLEAMRLGLLKPVDVPVVVPVGGIGGVAPDVATK